MFGKVGAYLDLMRKGSEVTDPEKWKSRQISGTIVAGVLIALVNLAKAYGYDIPIDANDLNELGLGIVAIVNIVLTCTTSSRAGLLPSKPVSDEPAVGPVSAPVQKEAAVGTPQQWSIDSVPANDPPVQAKDTGGPASDSGDVYIG